MTAIVIQRLTNQDRGFYPLMGPFLSRREIVREVGGPIWDEDNKTWYVARARGRVAGFCAARDDGEHVTFLSAYVKPERRRQGVYRALFLARIDDHPGRRLRAMCTAPSLPMFLAHGFTVHRPKGSFTEVRSDA